LDTGALIYAANRLPAVISAVERVVLGQLPEHFAQALGVAVDVAWIPVQTPARRRQWHYDGARTLAAHVTSTSDIDDVIPMLVAYQIEWNKLHRMLRGNAHFTADSDAKISAAAEDALRTDLGIGSGDWQRLRTALGDAFWTTLHRMAAAEKDFVV